VPLVHVPAWHVAIPLQRLPSSQLVPFETSTWETVPVVTSQLSAVHGLPSSIVVGVPERHAPLASQRSPVVQAFPSVHGVLLGFVG
jgi:hypothetical protein